MSSDTEKFAVFGNPIKHSLSPSIHAAFAKQFDTHIDYQKHCVDTDKFSQMVAEFFSDGGKGLNITVPFKQEAFEYADSLSERAQAAGAVNTLALQEDGTVLGDNTDGYGLVLDIKTHLGWTITNAKVLVVGAGGAVRGVLLPLLKESPSAIHIVNRTKEKALALAEQFKQYGNIQATSFDALSKDKKSFDIIINGTSASLGGELPPLAEHCIGSNTCVYDMVYGNTLTPFLNWSKKLGAKAVADGLGMLVGQAAESYRIWRSDAPNIAPVIEMLRHRSQEK